MDCQDELANLQASLQEQGSPRENSSSATVTEDWFDRIVQLTINMQQVLIGQQQLLQQISMAQLHTRQYSSIRLPKLEISFFFFFFFFLFFFMVLWTEFLDSFGATIHKNTKMSNIEKLNYLMSTLTRAAIGIRTFTVK